MMRMTDSDQNTTYAAEDMLVAWLDAVDPELGTVNVTLTSSGSPKHVTYSPEIEPKFGSPAEVTPFVAKAMKRLEKQAKKYGSNYRGRESKAVRVVSHTGWKKATYSNGIIRLPGRESGGAWALRGLVVLHELAHHLNTGVNGTIIDSHGEGFRRTFVTLLEDLGWTEMSRMLRDAYREVGLDRPHTIDNDMIVKVGKLLRHAEGASTEAERETFFAKAQELATAHSIELAVARANHEKRASTQKPTFESVQVGHRGQPTNVRFVQLILAIARANDLRCSIQADNTGVTLYGFAGDIEVTKTLYMSLAVQMAADADAYIRSGAHRPTHGRTARAAFYSGWTTRIGQRLKKAQNATRASAIAEDDSTTAESTSKDVALRAKEVEVDDYYGYMKRQHGISGTWRGASHVSDLKSNLRGRAAADTARIGNEKALKPARSR